MSDETKIFTKNDKNGDKCASGGQESGLKLIFERGVAILVRPWRFPGQPKKFVFFSIKVGTINSGTSLDSREQFKKTGKLELHITVKGVKTEKMKKYDFSAIFREKHGNELPTAKQRGSSFRNCRLTWRHSRRNTVPSSVS